MQSSAKNSDRTLFQLNSGVLRLDYVGSVGDPKSEDPKLIIRVNTFEVAQHAIAIAHFALRAACGKNPQTGGYQLIELIF